MGQTDQTRAAKTVSLLRREVTPRELERPAKRPIDLTENRRSTAQGQSVASLAVLIRVLIGHGQTTRTPRSHDARIVRDTHLLSPIRNLGLYRSL